MAVDARPKISGAVEGDVDNAVLGRLVDFAGAKLGTTYGRTGKPDLLKRLHGYNRAAQYGPWAALVDLDQDCACAPTCRDRWLPVPSKFMCFRIAVRAVEAWLLADAERIAELLRVPRARIPTAPDELEDPKRTLVDLARRSRSRAVRDEMVPRERGGRRVGPLYQSNLIRFIDNEDDGWRPQIAADASESLSRCVRSLQRLVEVVS